MNAICLPHFERAKRKVPASFVVNAEPMCSDCFEGMPIETCEADGRLNFDMVLAGIYNRVRSNTRKRRERQLRRRRRSIIRR